MVKAQASLGRAQSDRGTILACLAQVRSRLFAVRLIERLSVALAWGAGFAALLAAARLLRERYPIEAALGAALTIVPAAWLWQRAAGHKGIVFTPVMLRIGAMLTVLLAICGVIIMLIPFGAAVSVWQILVGAVGVFTIAAVASVRRVDLRTAAIFVDQEAGLEERVSTALEMLEAPGGSPFEMTFRKPVIQSALGACQQVKHANVGYQRLDRRVYAVAATVALAAAGISLLTPLPALARPSQQKFIVVANTAKRMSDVLKEIEAKKLPNDTVTAEKIKPLQAKLSQLNKGDVGPVEAGALLEEAKAQMQKDKEAMEASDKVVEALKAMEQTQEIAAATDPLKDARMQQAAGDSDAGKHEQSAKDGLDKATQNLADKMKGGGMSETEKKGLTDGLKNAADKAAGDSQLQRDLENAASAAQKGDSDAMAKNMQAASERMGEQRADQAMSQDAVNRAMAEINQMEHNGMTGSEQMAQSQGGPGQSSDGQQGGQQGDQQGGQNGDQANNGNPSGDQNKSGQGQGNGEQSANGNKSGSGQTGKDGGQGSEQVTKSGSTNMEERGGPGDHNVGNDIGRIGTYVKIYDQKEIKTAGAQEKVDGQINPLGAASGTAQVMGLADKTDSSIHTYSQELPGARQRAMDDLNKQDIPPQYQDMVREFYTAPEAKKPG